MQCNNTSVVQTGRMTRGGRPERTNEVIMFVTRHKSSVDDTLIHAIGRSWARLPQSLVLRGECKGWRKITKRCKDFLIGRGPKIRKNTQGKKQKISEIEQLAVSNSTGSIDWNREAELTKSLLSQTNKCNDSKKNKSMARTTQLEQPPKNCVRDLCGFRQTAAAAFLNRRSSRLRDFDRPRAKSGQF